MDLFDQLMVLYPHHNKLLIMFIKTSDMVCVRGGWNIEMKFKKVFIDSTQNCT